MTQTALLLTLPARDQQERIRREVAAILREHVGALRALPRERIAAHVRARLSLDSMKPATVLRRVRECRDALLDDGMRIVSGPEGWYLAETADEVLLGSEAQWGNAFACLRKAARYDRLSMRAAWERMGQRVLALQDETEVAP